jgi:hypothetical protein
MLIKSELFIRLLTRNVLSYRLIDSRGTIINIKCITKNQKTGTSYYFIQI